MTAVTVKVLVQQNITRVAVAGMRGQQGVGLPAGGETGQLLAKLSDDPYDIGFVDPDSIPERVTEVTATAPITSTGGSTPDIGISPATVSAAGSMSALDKAKLDAVAIGATNTPLSNNTPQTVASGSTAGVAITASRSDHAHAHGTQAGGSLHALATSSASGFMSAGQANKLAAIADGAQVNVPTNLGVGGSGNARTITSSTGAAAALPLAASSTAGLMSTGEHNKLAGVADGATVYTDALARGQVEAMLIAGANVTLSYSGSGASRTITIAATGEGGGGSGTVTSVGLSLPAELSVSGSPVTTSGTLTATWADQPANRVFAGPATGADATPGLRALVADDIPGLPAAQIRSAQEQRLLGWGQFVDSLGSGQLIELGTGFGWDGGTLNLSTNLQGWHALATSEKQDVLTSGTNIKTVGSTSLLGSGDVPFPVASVSGRTGAVTLSDADVPAGIITETGTSRAMANSDAGSYIRFTNASAKTATFGTGVNVVGQEFHIRNVGANNLTLTPSSTTLNAPAGGTLIVPPGGTVTVKQVASTEFDVFGSTT